MKPLYKNQVVVCAQMPSKALILPEGPLIFSGVFSVSKSQHEIQNKPISIFILVRLKAEYHSISQL